ncbi:hypothetical protein G9C98_001346 [Cotesia typhae]|uniref:SH3 domain-containing protein n=1 Tax=Cotesia typhae TaxID=2053667 RepID=A0A8J5UNT9_9HYME|nr:hypothetical protein G9C98_001346 [Cotesia typhae]
MAFLCPVRIRRGKKKKLLNCDLISAGAHNFSLEKDGLGSTTVGLGSNRVALPPGRITGSASIETLVRVGIEKENGLSPDSKMVIIHDFTPCVDDELQVKRGQVVNILYRENDWVYVIAADTRMEGFVPHSYCAPYTSQLAEQTLASLMNNDPSAGRYIVLYTFVARDENDVSVERGEFVTVLNRDDPDWFWVLRHCDGNEGFVPSGFVYPGHVLHSYQTTASTTTTTTSPVTTTADHNLGTELVVLYDYKAQAPDDLSVRRADWIYADLGNQTVDGWLWAYAPKTRKYGFIPKAYARPPAMTSL